jgi:hypothetical protein
MLTDRYYPLKPKAVKIIKQPPSRYLYIVVIGAIVQLAVFKYFYPTADYTLYSHNYINAAAQKAGFSLWPIGYSLFLRLIHSVSHADYAVVICQYVLLQAGVFLLFTTVTRFCELPSHIKNTLFVTLAFNPVLLYVANYILPDALFTTASLLWLVSLLYIIHKPTLLSSVVHAVVLALLLTLKIQGLFYPAVSIITIAFIHQPIARKALTLGLSLFATVLTLAIILQVAKIETGRRQLPAIVSWQIANNALYGYQPSGGFDRPLPAEAAELNKRMLAHFTADPKHFTPRDGSMYINGFVSPLRQYWLDYVLKDQTITEEKAWCDLAPTAFAWGTHTVREHPGAYLRYHILPNTLHYLLPLINEAAAYNSASRDVNAVVKEWFDYSTTTVTCRFPMLQGVVFLFYSAMFFVTNLLIIIGVVFFFIKKYKPNMETPTLKQLSILIVSFYVANALFSITYQPIDIISMLVANIVYPTFILLAVSLYTRPEPAPTSSLI